MTHGGRRSTCPRWNCPAFVPKAVFPLCSSPGCYIPAWSTPIISTPKPSMENAASPRGKSDPIPALLHRMRSKAASWLNAPPSTPLNEKRNQVLRACMSAGAAWQRGAYTLTVPTGGGKTFDSLAFSLEHAAHNHMDRIIYVIPYTSIIDQTVAVFSDLLGAENVLAHHAGAGLSALEEQEMSPADYRRAPGG